MGLYNILGLFKNNKIKLVEKRLETKDSYLFSFEFNPRLEWKAGQHGMFSFKGEKLNGGNFRPFSIASNRKENRIMILTKIGDKPSEFKDRLRSMKIGEFIYLRGPFGGFYISNYNYNKPICMIAGGTGITPMRAILKDIEDNSELKDVELMYIDNSGEYAFREELEAIEKNNSKIKIYFLDKRNDLNDKILNFINRHNNGAIYFISGNPTMVRDIKNKIKDQKIKKINIISDSFRGYK